MKWEGGEPLVSSSQQNHKRNQKKKISTSKEDNNVELATTESQCAEYQPTVQFEKKEVGVGLEKKKSTKGRSKQGRTQVQGETVERGSGHSFNV